MRRVRSCGGRMRRGRHVERRPTGATGDDCRGQQTEEASLKDLHWFSYRAPTVSRALMVQAPP